MSWISNNISSLRDYIIEKQELSTRDKECLTLIYQDNNELKDITIFIKDCFENLLDPTIISVKITANAVIILRKKQDIQTYVSEKKYTVEKYNTNLIRPLESLYEKNEEDFLHLLRKSSAKVEWIFDLLNRGQLTQQDFTAILLDIKKLNPNFIELINLFGSHPQSYRLYEKKYAYENLMWDWYHKSHPFFSVIEDIKTVASAQEARIKDYLLQMTIKELKADLINVEEETAFNNAWWQIGQMIKQFDNFELATDVVFQRLQKIYNHLEQPDKLKIQYHVFDVNNSRVSFTDEKFSIEVHSFDKVMDYLKLLASDIAKIALEDWENMKEQSR